MAKLSMPGLIEAFLVGALAAMVIIYAFQTRIPYPRWVLQSIDKPWVLLLALLVAVFLVSASPRLGALAVILVLAVWLDIYLFARAPLGSGDTTGLDTPLHTSDPVATFPDAYDEPLELQAFEHNGPALASVPLATPQYPTFFGLDAASPGPAPFHPL